MAQKFADCLKRNFVLEIKIALNVNGSSFWSNLSLEDCIAWSDKVSADALSFGNESDKAGDFTGGVIAVVKNKYPCVTTFTIAPC